MVRIVHTPPASSLVVPTDAELRKLIEVVYRARQDLDLRADRDFRHLDHDREFRLAFLTVGAMGRIEGVDHGKAISYWADYARNILYEAGNHAEMPGNILFAAALAHGDVDHAKNALGLIWVETGRRAGDAWRGVLRTGQIRERWPEQATNSRPGRVTIDLNVARDHVGFVGSVVR
ncbi:MULTISPECIES: hypothetical protein [unclassified Bradyrhizobium]|uniref:hypothetical protein n=1 Tax=unclassified Bradyrhizobium TaxID=2631580 RepID=UPI0028EF8FA9|nr:MULTISPECIES: hypothetical protein [unclassified Bradyrhizobium]